MVKLSSEEQSWLIQGCPQLKYDALKNCLFGVLCINHHYKDLPAIRASFEIRVPLNYMVDRNEYPKVYNTDGKIQKMAKLKRVPPEDFHVYSDNSLCLGLPERFHDYYPNGFNIQQFIKHLTEHLYWVSYFERYNEPPWDAELHGDSAKIDYYIEQHDIEKLRYYLKKSFGVGMSKAKLRNYLKSERLIKNLKLKIKNNG